jgi:hypothetical protein
VYQLSKRVVRLFRCSHWDVSTETSLSKTEITQFNVP